MTQISVSELKVNAGKYVAMAQNEDIFITKNGKLIARLTTAKPDKTAAAQALFGILPTNIDLNKERDDKLNENRA